MVDYKEEERIRALRRYQILDTPPDGSFDRLTALAAKIFNVPISIVSLVDTDRIWFKSHHGLEINQIDKEPGLCASAVFADDVYIVENAKQDPRTLTNPLVVSDFGLRFYAAAPLKTMDGHSLGTLCIIDKKQRYLTESQKGILHEMAQIAMDEVEIRLASRNAAQRTVEFMSEIKEHLRRITPLVQNSPHAEPHNKIIHQMLNYLDEIKFN